MEKINIKSVIFEKFPKEKYSLIFKIIESVESSDANDLKKLMVKLGQKPMSKSLNIYVISKFVFYAFELENYENLKSQHLIDLSKIEIPSF